MNVYDSWDPNRRNDVFYRRWCCLNAELLRFTTDDKKNVCLGQEERMFRIARIRLGGPTFYISIWKIYADIMVKMYKELRDAGEIIGEVYYNIVSAKILIHCYLGWGIFCKIVILRSIINEFQSNLSNLSRKTISWYVVWETCIGLLIWHR